MEDSYWPCPFCNRNIASDYRPLASIPEALVAHMRLHNMVSYFNNVCLACGFKDRLFGPRVPHPPPTRRFRQHFVRLYLRGDLEAHYALMKLRTGIEGD